MAAALIGLSIAASVHAQNVASKPPTLTSRMVDVVNQTNRLTAQVATLQADKAALEQMLVATRNDQATLIVFMYDLICKWNNHMDYVASKSFADAINNNTTLEVSRLACDKVSASPELPPKIVTPTLK
jgi:hypothetical protein